MRKSPYAVGAVATLLAFGASAAGTSVAQASTGSIAYVVWQFVGRGHLVCHGWLREY